MSFPPSLGNHLCPSKTRCCISTHANYIGQCKYLPLWAWLSLEIRGSKGCPSKGWDNGLIPQEGSFLRIVLVLPCPVVSVLFYSFWKSWKKQDWAPEVLFHSPLWGGDHQPRLLPQRPTSIPVSVLPHVYRIFYWYTSTKGWPSARLGKMEGVAEWPYLRKEPLSSFSNRLSPKQTLFPPSNPQGLPYGKLESKLDKGL